MKSCLASILCFVLVFACEHGGVSAQSRDAIASAGGTTDAVGKSSLPRILRVINLHDGGPGSLRAAIETEGPRVVVFEVSGTIHLAKDVVVRSPYVTIAGQTAPSPGITLKGAGIAIRTHDVRLQHLRVRVGDEPGGQPYPSRDAVSIIGPNAFNVIVDHVSASWAIDENLSMWYPVNNVTVTNCIISEGLHRSYHNKGPHSKGILVGNNAKNIMLSGNLIAHNYDRFPLIKGDSTVIFANNLCYNSGSDRYIQIEDTDNVGPTHVAIIGNLFTNGRDTPLGTVMIKVHRSLKAGSTVIFRNNSYDGQQYRVDSLILPNFEDSQRFSHLPAALPASQLEHRILACAGARPADRDRVDQRIIDDYKQRTGRIIDSQKVVGGWPELAERRRPLLLPKNPFADDDRNGENNLFEFLKQMSVDVEGHVCGQPPSMNP